MIYGPSKKSDGQIDKLKRLNGKSINRKTWEKNSNEKKKKNENWNVVQKLRLNNHENIHIFELYNLFSLRSVKNSECQQSKKHTVLDNKTF